jgi:anti-sigma factor RsiW
MSSRHLSEDELVLHFYGEMDGASEGEATSHLDACSSCSHAYARLQRVFAAIDESASAPLELAPSFERTVWARLEPNLQLQRRGWRAWLQMWPAALSLAAAVLVLVTGAYFAGRGLVPSTPPAQAPAAAAGPRRERIQLATLGERAGARRAARGRQPALSLDGGGDR